MNGLTKIMNLFKQNPLIIICGVVIVLSAVSFYWPTSVGGTAFVKEMQTRSSEIGKIQQYFNKSVVIPAPNPDDRPVLVKTVIKPQVIETVQKINEDLQTQYREIFKLANSYNMTGHEVMLQGLFPEPTDPAKPFNAQRAYLAEFLRMHRALNPGQPVDADTVRKALDKVQEDYLRNIFPTPTSLDIRQQAEIAQRQAQKLLDLYESNAEKIGVYADPIFLNINTPNSWKPGPFEIGTWAAPGTQPSLDTIWEGQMQLWIQQDLVRAVRLANNLDSATVEINGKQVTPSVLNQPIKRLVSIQITPGYIGDPAANAGLNTNQRLPDNFTPSHTGRTTNPLYNVRHATVVMHVDTLKIPQVIKALSNVNFMTVLGMKVTDVDEYEALNAGYHYGGVSISQIELKIETLWMRQWLAGHPTPQDAAAEYAATLPKDHEFHAKSEEEKVEYVKTHGVFRPGLMPDSVRVRLGLAPRDPSFKGAGTEPTGPQRGARHAF